MIFRETVGIAIDNNVAHCLRLKSLFPWGGKSIVKEAFQIDIGDTIVNFEKTIERVSRFPRRYIYLGLPRDLFFSRNILFSNMTVEDAVDSVKSSMALYSHVPVEDIYFDVYVNKLSRKELNILIYYAIKKDIDPFLDVIRRAGHEKNLRGLYPISHGWCAWAMLNGHREEKGVWITTRNHCELALYNNQGPLNSFFYGENKTEDTQDGIKQNLITASSLSAREVVDFASIESCPKYNHLPNPAKNSAVIALAPALAGFQQVAVDGSPTRLKLLRPFPLIFLLCVVLSTVGFFFHKKVQEHRNEIILGNKILTQQINVLKNKMKPLAEGLLALEKIENFQQDVENFMDKRLSLNTCINEIARVVPKGTWFENFNFRGEIISMNGESSEALKVIESIRTLTIFSSVKLHGSVSRTPAGKEKFRVQLDTGIDNGGGKKP